MCVASSRGCDLILVYRPSAPETEGALYRGFHNQDRCLMLPGSEERHRIPELLQGADQVKGARNPVHPRLCRSQRERTGPVINPFDSTMLVPSSPSKTASKGTCTANSEFSTRGFCARIRLPKLRIRLTAPCPSRSKAGWAALVGSRVVLSIVAQA
jgi:hypothetical protein